MCKSTTDRPFLAARLASLLAATLGLGLLLSAPAVRADEASGGAAESAATAARASGSDEAVLLERLARGGTLEVIGKEKQEIAVRTLFRAVSENNIIKGMAVYIDHYGNVITNINESLFKSFGNGRRFTIFFRSEEYEIKTINPSYCSVEEGERVALFSSTGYIEIAMNKGNASKLFGVNQGDLIRIEFYD